MSIGFLLPIRADWCCAGPVGLAHKGKPTLNYAQKRKVQKAEVSLCDSLRALRMIGRQGGWNLGDLSEKFVRVEADDLGKIEQFDNIDATASGLYSRDDRLVATECFSDLRLGKPCLFAIRHEQVNETFLAW